MIAKVSPKNWIEIKIMSQQMSVEKNGKLKKNRRKMKNNSMMNENRKFICRI